MSCVGGAVSKTCGEASAAVSMLNVSCGRRVVNRPAGRVGVT